MMMCSCLPACLHVLERTPGERPLPAFAQPMAAGLDKTLAEEEQDIALLNSHRHGR